MFANAGLLGSVRCLLYAHMGSRLVDLPAGALPLVVFETTKQARVPCDLSQLDVQYGARSLHPLGIYQHHLADIYTVRCVQCG